MSQTFNYSKKIIHELFSGPVTYRVPDYQRSYAWPLEVVEEFWGDLEDAMNQDLKQYFLGTVVLIPRKGTGIRHFEVVDGQQRLATLSILFTVMKNHIKEVDPDDSDFLLTNVIQRIYYQSSSSSKVIRVKMNGKDNSYFSRYIIDDSASDDLRSQLAEKDSEKRLFKAYNFLLDRVRQKTNDKGTSWLQKYYNFLTERVMVIAIEVGDDSDAFHIFESINAKGVSLLQMDLIKNMMISQAAKENRQEMVAIWDRITSQFSETVAFRFFRYYWMSRFELLRKKGFYRKVKSKIMVEKLTPEELLQDLEEHSKVYEVILYPGKSPTPEIRHTLKGLKTLGVTQVHPILLATANRYGMDSDQFEEVSEALLSFVVRRFIIGKSNPNEFERSAGSLARAVRSKKMTVPGLVAELKKDSPNDKNFSDDFLLCTFKSSRAPKYLLRELNRSYSKTREIEIIGKVHLEHILPQKPTESWTRSFKDEDEDIDEWIQRLGNLTLIDDTLNKKISNKSFVEKKRKYNASEIRITKKLCDYGWWGPNEIKHRQKLFAKRAVKIWRIG